MRRLRQLSLMIVAAALLIVGAQLVACGGGEPGGGEALSLPEYLQRMDAVRADMHDRSFALDERHSEQLEAASTDEEWLDAYRRGFGERISVESDHLDDVKSLDPPAEAEAPHQDYVDALAEGVEFLADFNDRMDGVDSRSEVDDLWDEAGGDFDEISRRITDACSALQDLADEHGIDVNLEC